MPNPNGSARGLKFIKNNTTIFALPGVPMEMKKMISEYIIPQIRENINNPIFRELCAPLAFLNQNFNNV